MLFMSFLESVKVTLSLMPSFLILFLSDLKYLNLDFEVGPTIKP